MYKLKVALTLDRYLSIRLKTWRLVYFKQNQAIFTSILIGALLMATNSHLLVLNRTESLNDQGELVFECYGKGVKVDWVQKWKIVN
jgi:hypothetical protein